MVSQVMMHGAGGGGDGIFNDIPIMFNVMSNVRLQTYKQTDN